jgi:hypothetical protein
LRRRPSGAAGDQPTRDAGVHRAERRHLDEHGDQEQRGERDAQAGEAGDGQRESAGSSAEQVADSRICELGKGAGNPRTAPILRGSARVTGTRGWRQRRGACNPQATLSARCARRFAEESFLDGRP